MVPKQGCSADSIPNLLAQDLRLPLHASPQVPRSSKRPEWRLHSSLEFYLRAHWAHTVWVSIPLRFHALPFSAFQLSLDSQPT